MNQDMVLDLLGPPLESTPQDQSPPEYRLVLDSEARRHLLAALAEALTQPYLPKLSKRHARDRIDASPQPFSAVPATTTSSRALALEAEFSQALRTLDRPFKFERSIQFRSQGINSGRMLAGFDLASPSPLPKESALNLLQRLHFPAQYLEAVLEYLPASHYLHLGFEPYQGAALFKVYLESEADAQSIPPIRHRAWKYVPLTDQCFTSTYAALPVVSASQLSQLVLKHFQSLSADASLSADLMPLLEVVGSIIERCVSVENVEDIDLLYATENQSPRQSFDLNLYAANHTVGTVVDELLRLCELLGLDHQRCRLSLQHCLAQPLGHLSFGFHRHREPFFTLYYGASSVA